MKIYKNSHTLSNYYFIQIGVDFTKSYGYRISDASGKWKICKAVFDNKILNEDEKMTVVGDIDINQLIIDAVLKEVQNAGSEV